MQSISSDHNRIKSKVNKRKTIWKISNSWELNITLTNNPWVKGKLTKDIRTYFVMNENEKPTSQKFGMHLNRCFEKYVIASSIYVRKEEMS